MNKEFIPYEQALELKQLGFDEPCFGCYFHNNKDAVEYNPDGIPLNHNNRKSRISAPLYQQAFRWFREQHGLTGLVEIGTQEFSYQVFDDKGNRQLGNQPLSFNGNYEEAELACVKELIKIVKHKS